MSHRRNLEAAIRTDPGLSGHAEPPDPIKALHAKAKTYPANPNYLKEQRDYSALVKEAALEFNPTPEEKKELEDNHKALQEAFEKQDEIYKLASALKDTADEEDTAFSKKEEEIKALLKDIQDEMDLAKKELEEALKNHPDDKQYHEKLKARINKLSTMHAQTQSDFNLLHEQRPKIAELKKGCAELFGGEPPQKPSSPPPSSLKEVNEALLQKKDQLKASNFKFSQLIAPLKSLYAGIANTLSSIMDRTRKTRGELSAMQTDKPQPSSDLKASLK